MLLIFCRLVLTGRALLSINMLAAWGTHQLHRVAYLALVCLQLSYGLSTEYSKSPADSKSDNIDADRQIYAKYYVSQIMQLGEEGIRDAWSKVCCPLCTLIFLMLYRETTQATFSTTT